MAKVLKCDSIFPGCEGEVRGETEDEVMKAAVQHARDAHGVQEIDEATANKVRAAIGTE